MYLVYFSSCILLLVTVFNYYFLSLVFVMHCALAQPAPLFRAPRASGLIVLCIILCMYCMYVP